MTLRSSSGGRRPAPDLRRYGLVVFDLDGTLYRQSPVRLGMMGELLATPPSNDGIGRLARLRILRRFRQLREEFALTLPTGFERPLIERLSAETGIGEVALRTLVDDWMERRPLGRLRAARVAGAAELFAALRARGQQIAVWSDYAVRDKLAVLDLAADHVLSARDPELATLKPDPAGLLMLLRRTGFPADATLMIGDRDSHDGAAARAAGVAFLLRARRGPPGLPRVRDFRDLAKQLVEPSP
ncbi:HAD family hydrolase [Rubellimicrobium rubrum]|uniref:phosphoglycolate phosphatase n=1 Tax=Rubellimicrobium rubrum TaxID=2585369 RepID=A0A5C4MSW5_9RHOB|nr:HAD family hydrolase [Rubellimicrobium rubrum]TNC47717.1 HAD family hydrolase [Rubellimicrobium rubrum]